MENGYEYTVKEGDTLSEILYNITGSGNKEMYEQIAMDNNISNADYIVPGQKIIIGQDYLNTDTTQVSSASSNQETPQTPASVSSINQTQGSDIKSTTTSNAEISRGDSDIKESAIFETSDQSEFEELLSKKSHTQETREEMLKTKNSPDMGKTNTEKAQTTPQINTNQSNQESPSSSYTISSTYTPSDFEICYPQSVSGFDPRNSFKTFQIKENAGEHFVAVNNQVKKCGNDIDGIITSLTTLKTKMGENTGTVTQIDKIIESLEQKKQDLITKNSELIEACNKVIEYVYENKASKASAASKVSNTIANINIYQG